MFAASVIFIVSVGLLFVDAEKRNITAEPGHDVTLPCRAGDGKIITTVQWNRADLEPEYVYFYRDGRSESDHQHPSFQQRVDLQDRQMKDGNMSLILKNVTADDTGTYECRIFQREKGERFADIKSISIHLEVSPAGRTQDGGDKDGGDEDGGHKEGGEKAAGRTQDAGDKAAEHRGHPGLIVGLSAGILVVVGGFFKKKNSAPPHII